MRKIIKSISVSIAIFGASLVIISNAHADQDNAKNFIIIATGGTSSANDAKIKSVERQLDAIQGYCSATSSGAGIHDKLAKSHSLLKTKQSLLELLSDFVSIASAQCNKIDSGTLISLYVLERNSGEKHTATVMRLTKNPRALIAKWSAR